MEKKTIKIELEFNIAYTTEENKKKAIDDITRDIQEKITNKYHYKTLLTAGYSWIRKSINIK